MGEGKGREREREKERERGEGGRNSGNRSLPFFEVRGRICKETTLGNSSSIPLRKLSFWKHLQEAEHDHRVLRRQSGNKQDTNNMDSWNADHFSWVYMMCKDFPYPWQNLLKLKHDWKCTHRDTLGEEKKNSLMEIKMAEPFVTLTQSSTQKSKDESILM